MIIVKIMGGLGNQMFQYALGRRLSIERGVPLFLDIGWFGQQNKRAFELNQFHINAEIASYKDVRRLNPILGIKSGSRLIKRLDRYLPIHLKTFYSEKESGNYDSKVLSLGNNSIISGYWQSEKYFNSISSVLGQEFSIKEPLSADDEHLAKKIAQNPKSVMVHVRRGDYTAEYGTIIAHYVCTPDYYQETMSLINKRLGGKAKFFIFTDDPEWCEENLVFPSDYLIISNRERIASHELVLMSKCNHVIMSNSSFCWWGVWLSDSKEKIVYYPKLWFTRKSSPDLPRKHWISYQHDTKNDWKYIDIPYAQDRYFAKFGKYINFDAPQSFTEKIQWIKIYDRNPLLTKLADKYLVRDYVAKKVGEKYLTTLYGVFESASEIEWKKLPNKFVLKSNHGSGWNIICKDKKKLDRKVTFEKLAAWLKQNYYYYGREWVYKNIPPKIVCEEYLDGDKTLGLLDYKIFCFNGEPGFIQVDMGRYIHHTQIFFDLNWNALDFTMNHPKPQQSIPRPRVLEEMIMVSKTLADDLKFVRVDLYAPADRVLFGELTFYPEAGFCDIFPRKYDQIIGMWLKLPLDNLQVDK